MSPCRDIEAYLDRSLEPAGRESFDEHLGHCQACRERVRNWRDIEVDIMLWAEARTDYQPDAMQARRLVSRARAHTREQQQRAVRRPWVWATGFAAAAAAIIAVVVVPRLGDQDAGLPPSEALAMRVIDNGGSDISPADTVAGATLTAATNKRLLVELGDDRVAVSRASRVDVVAAVADHVRLRLRAGSVALDVMPRKSGEKVEVEVGDYLVSVVGTRFMVSVRPSGGIEVDVAEGRVRVSGLSTGIQEVTEAQKLRVNKTGKAALTIMPTVGRRSLERLLRSPEPVEPVASWDNWDGAGVEPFEVGPRERERAAKRRKATRPRTSRADELTLWRQWVLDGKYDAAERALSERVKSASDDGNAWSLLADCRRKAGRYGPAVKAYRQASVVAEPAVANRARFMAASILQDELSDHGPAVALLRAYLAEGQALRPLEAAAQVRLARSLGKVGKHDAARELLEAVVEQHPGTPAAADARRLLSR